MKIVIFGATGGVGQHLITQLLEKSHELTIFSRKAVSLNNPNLRFVIGDVTNIQAVTEAISGQDVVICALGAPMRDKSMIRTKGTQTITNAMIAKGVKRIICLSSFGVGSSRKYLPWLYKYLLAPLLLNIVFNDHKHQEDVLNSSGLDWIVVRPGNFVDTSLTQSYKHGKSESAKNQKLTLKISRADVAHFIIEQISSNTYLKEAAWVSYHD